MLALSDIIDGPNSTIHYWVSTSHIISVLKLNLVQGFSYGTTIGNYFINSEFLDYLYGSMN